MDQQQENHSSKNLEDHSVGRVGRAVKQIKSLGIIGIIDLLRKHGIRGSYQFITRNIQHISANYFAKRWDRKHGVDTAGSIRLDLLNVVGPNKDLGNECVCTSPNSFRFIMENMPDDMDQSNCTFIDLGCGKGRTLLLATQYKFPKIVGVEFASELVVVAKLNIEQFFKSNARKSDVSVLEEDATSYVFPDTDLLVYFYNPFSKPVFDKVIESLLNNLAEKPRNCFIVYGSSSHDAISWAAPTILETGHFSQLPTRKMPYFIDSIRRINFAIFKYEADKKSSI